MLADGLPHHDLVKTLNGYRNQPVVDGLIGPCISDTSLHLGHLRGAANLLHLGADEDANTGVCVAKIANNESQFERRRSDGR